MDFAKKVEEVYEYMSEILIKKNESYGSASLQGGKMAIIGNMFRQKDKMNRYQNLITQLVESGEMDIPFEESIWDTICDIWGYATLGLIIAEREGFGSFTKEDTIDNLHLNCYPKPVTLDDQVNPYGFDPEDDIVDNEIGVIIE